MHCTFNNRSCCRACSLLSCSLCFGTAAAIVLDLALRLPLLLAGRLLPAPNRPSTPGDFRAAACTPAAVSLTFDRIWRGPAHVQPVLLLIGAARALASPQLPRGVRLTAVLESLALRGLLVGCWWPALLEGAVGPPAAKPELPAWSAASSPLSCNAGTMPPA
jgi:hypothetical protein